MKCSGNLWTILLTSNFLEGITVNRSHVCYPINENHVAELTKREFSVSIFLSFVAVLPTRLCRRFGYVPVSLSPFWIVAVLVSPFSLSPFWFVAVLSILLSNNSFTDKSAEYLQDQSFIMPNTIHGTNYILYTKHDLNT